jgi:hypothetical protein
VALDAGVRQIREAAVDGISAAASTRPMSVAVPQLPVCERLDGGPQTSGRLKPAWRACLVRPSRRSGIVLLRGVRLRHRARAVMGNIRQRTRIRIVDGDRHSAAGPRPSAAVLAGCFGPQVADLVDAVTNPEYPPGTDRDRQVPGARRGQSRWQPVGTGDKGVGLHRQLRQPDSRHQAQAVKLSGKYAPLVPVLAGLIARPDTPLSSPG